MGKAAVSQEEIQLRKRARRRLVGAAFLVLVMVVVLPLLLDAEPRPQAEAVRVRMPTPQPEVDDPAPLRAPAKAAPGLSGADAPRPESATPKDATPNGVTPREAPPSIADVPPPDPEAAPAPAPKKAAPPATVDPSPAMQQASVQAEASQSAKPVEGADDDALKPPVVIQLGAYIKAENAQQLKADLQAKRIKAYTEAVAFGATTKTRVRAGPYDSLAEAEKVRVRIEKMNLKLGMAPKIVPQGQ